jgi:glycosyltransferase involved in cell wall biosynthesis
MISGITIIRNGIKYDYPFIESIKSLLPICDEVIVVAGNSDDGTNEAIAALNEPKIKLIHTVWDETLRSGGKILAQQTNIGIQAAKGDWLIYLQGDEVLNEAAKLEIKKGIEVANQHKKIDGLLFPYYHFYGGYNYIKTARSAYRYEIRVFKNKRHILSYRDAQGFRKYESFEKYVNEKNIGEKLNVIKIDTPVFHYGYVKPPEIMQLKSANFNKLWHSDETVKAMVGTNIAFDYSNYDGLEIFTKSHPNIMHHRVSNQNWHFEYEPHKAKIKFKHKVLQLIEKWTGRRFFEYKNYNLVKL